MGNMEENKEIIRAKKTLPPNDVLMKPFSMGWTREVVMRVVTKNRAPTCDIYYFSPSKKKIRSMTELKTILTDGLTPECFSFKREPLGLSSDLETVRDAKSRGKTIEKNKEKGPTGSKKLPKPNNLKEHDSDTENDAKKQKTEGKDGISEELEKQEDNNKLEVQNNEEKEEGTKNSEDDSETKTKRIKQEKLSKGNNNFTNKKKTKRKSVESAAPVKSVRLRKNVLKRMISAKQAKQAKVVASKKILKKIVRKMAKPPNKKLTKKKNRTKTTIKSTKNKKLKLKTEKNPSKATFTKGKNDSVKETENNEADKKSRDLKSIVKKNIGKYREMREKQKLGAVKNQVRNTVKRTAIMNTSRTRSEPISKNKPFYLKPLEKGWRRELVYRSNCARAGQMADVYYFHPNGKKLRSCREIAENLTHGLSIECFTFRKEPIGCGEPSEVVRNARFIQKN